MDFLVIAPFRVVGRIEFYVDTNTNSYGSNSVVGKHAGNGRLFILTVYKQRRTYTEPINPIMDDMAPLADAMALGSPCVDMELFKLG